MDSWLPRDRITVAALESYEEFLQAHAKTVSDGKHVSLLLKARIDNHLSMVGELVQHSAIAEQQRRAERDARRGIATSPAAVGVVPQAESIADQRLQEMFVKVIPNKGLVKWVRIKGYRYWVSCGEPFITGSAFSA
jgi:hypothetical protein